MQTPASTSPYPKRSELRRAEAARAAARKGDDRRPAGGRPPTAPAGRRSAPPSPVEPARRPPSLPGFATPPRGFAPSRMPIAVAPTPAVLPIRQTSTTERPAGISMPVPPRVAPMPAFQRPSYADVPMVPLAVPAPPTPPAGLAAPDYLAFQPAQSAQSAQSARSAKRPAFPARLLGRGKAAGAARLLVLALVVGAEGVAVTTMSGHARSVPIDASVSSAFELTNASAALATQRQQAAETALLETHQRDSSSAKVTAAVAQAKAAAARVRAANERKAAVLRDAQNNPQAAAKVMLIDRGWGSAQFSCLVSLWNKESGWNYRAENPSGAYGIPQSLPGNKMASAGSDWRTNPVTQIRWGLDYIADRYGTPCGAWAHSEQYNSY